MDWRFKVWTALSEALAARVVWGEGGRARHGKQGGVRGMGVGVCEGEAGGMSAGVCASMGERESWAFGAHAIACDCAREAFVRASIDVGV